MALEHSSEELKALGSDAGTQVTKALALHTLCTLIFCVYVYVYVCRCILYIVYCILYIIFIYIVYEGRAPKVSGTCT